ncbi:helicase-related protein [Aeromonas hydrophila]|uniref:helicase-related protein n=1 Tax=Aeromonas hydrophila TaxID=644 RepID=UPI00165297FA|nr:helicase-related protein [Aeromonas hydrophila]
MEDSDILIDGVKLKKLLGKDSRLGQIINKVQGQTIIYVSRKDTAETRAKNISNTVSTFTPKPELTDLIEYISKNISEQWGLITCLKKGIAFHHSGVPKFIQTEIVELFNSGLINIIVCTPTLTEGVNTSAKNVVFYDTTKANINLTGFEVKNIIGRSGRFGQHFVGRAIFLEKHVEQDNIDEIRFPFFDYDQLPLEDYLQIEDNDLPPSGLKRKDTVISMALQQRVPIDVLRKNKYINFEKQLSLIKYLKENPLLRRQLYIKHKLPDKAQVDLIMHLIHDILFSDSDKKDTWTTGNLSRLVKYQIYYNPSIKQLITQHSAKKEDTKIRNILELVYRYFEFSLPKYIIALENILNFVYGDDVSLGMMATHLQYGSDETYNILLTDAGVPKSIISHLSPYIKDTGNIKEIKATIERSPHSLKGLSTIEIKMLSRRI